MFRRYPLWVLVVPMVIFLWYCEETGGPLDLLRETRMTWSDTTHVFHAVLTDDGADSRRTRRYEARVVGLCDSDYVGLPMRRVYLYIAQDKCDSTLGRGDTLLALTRIGTPGMLGSFDYGRYLRRQGIAGTGYVRQYVRIGDAEPEPEMRRRLIDRYRAAGVSAGAIGTLSALTLGAREELEPSIQSAFQRSGAMHVLAVSGLHTGILYMVLLWLLTGGGLWKPLYEQRGRRVALSVAVAGLLWLYAGLTGFSPSVCRSVLMVTIAEAAVCLRRDAWSLNTLAAAALVILAVRPNDLFSVSFQLSFAAMAAILLTAMPMKQSLRLWRLQRPAMRRATEYVADIAVVSLAAQLGVLPLTMYYFGQMSNYFLLTNLLALPLAWLIMVGALLTLTVGWLPGVGMVTGWMTDKLTLALNGWVGWIEQLPGSVTATPIDRPMMWLLYGAIAGGVLSLRKSLWWLVPTALCAGAYVYLWIH